MPLDYETLRVVWWALLGTLLIGFAVMDGFDLGVAMLHPFVTRDELQRRVLINAIGPVWEGNQVWLILGGGAVFAAWPLLYSASFSGFYFAMLLALLGLILRPVAITFRGKSPAHWRRWWDAAFFLSGVLPSFVFGVAFGNLFLGAPFHLDEKLQTISEGGFLDLLSPFAILCGLVSVAMLTMQGAAFLAGKTEGELAQRSRACGIRAALALMVLFAAAGYFIAFEIDGYVAHGVDFAGPSNPTLKNVTREAGAWLSNYRAYPATYAAPTIAFLGATLAAILLASGRARAAIAASSLSIAGVIATAGFSLFPFLFPSSTTPAHSLTVWDASSSQRTLMIMLAATAVFLPAVIAYTSWVFYVLRGPVTEAAIERKDDFSY